MKCRHGKRTWSGSEPECAFDEEGVYEKNGWDFVNGGWKKDE